MSRLRTSVALLLALGLPAAALAAPSAVHAWHHHHRHHHGRLVGVVPGWDLYGPSAGYEGYEGYEGGYSGYGSFGGQLYTRNSGGVNSMANDFGTSGVLGHTNGMPANSP